MTIPTTIRIKYNKTLRFVMMRHWTMIRGVVSGVSHEG